MKGVSLGKLGLFFFLLIVVLSDYMEVGVCLNDHCII